MMDGGNENAPGAAGTATGGQQTYSTGSVTQPKRRGRKKGTGKTGRVNRTPKQIAVLRQSLIDLVLNYGRATTIRHIYYLAVTACIGPKCTTFYQDCIRLLTEARRKGDLAFDWIVDNTRRVREPLTFTGIEQALNWLTQQYELNYWDQAEADCQVQIWCEADTVSHVLEGITFKYAVPFYCARGASSITFIHEAADAIEADGRPAFVYWFGDWDKTGVEIFEACRNDLLQWTPNTPVHIERLAVNQEQIERLGLLTHDCKDKHLVKWFARTGQTEVCELDAMDTGDLQALVEAAIVQHIDLAAFEAMKEREARDKQTLHDIAAKFGGAA